MIIIKTWDSFIKLNKLFESSKPIELNEYHPKADLTIPRDIQLDLHDMSYELRDEGYLVSYQWWPPYDISNKMYNKNKYPHINVTKLLGNDGLEKISYGWIKDFCERVKSYLDEMGYNVVIKYRRVNTNDYYDIDKSYPNIDPFTMAVSIHFKIEMIDRNIYGDVNE